VDLATQKVTTLKFGNLAPPALPPKEEAPPNAGAIVAPGAKLALAGPWTFTGEASVPAGTKLNPEAPMGWKVWRIDTAGPKLVAAGKLPAKSAAFSFAVPKGLEGATELRIEVRSFPCEEKAEGVCRIETRSWRVPATYAADGQSKTALPAK
jgi:hypothetical protein